MSKAKRYNAGKLKYSLLPPRAIEKIVDVYSRGAFKYSEFKKPDGTIVRGANITEEEASNYEMVYSGANNWKLGQEWLNTLESAERHIVAFKNGEDMDELGTYHLANAAWNLIAILEFYHIHPELDNREHWYKKPFKKLFLDLDDVIAGFSDSFLEYFEMDKEEAHDWNDHRFVNKLEQVKNEKDFWLNIKPLIHPKDIRYPVSGYCTARSIPEEWIQEWLDKNGFPVAPILRVNFGESKVQKLKEAGCDIMVDDNIKNFVELNSNGILCYLFSRSHNLKYSVGHLRVDDLCKFLKTLL